MICDGRLINACFAYFTLALVYNYLWFHDAIIADAREVNNLRTLSGGYLVCIPSLVESIPADAAYRRREDHHAASFIVYCSVRRKSVHHRDQIAVIHSAARAGHRVHRSRVESAWRGDTGTVLKLRRSEMIIEINNDVANPEGVV